MRNIIITVIISIFLAVLSSILVYRYAPLSWLENEQFRAGTTITTINGTDTLSSSRTVINNNFSALNNGKIEVGTTSVDSITTLSNLATVGTIGSGVWSGTALTWAKGGNASTTLSINQVLLGDTTTGFKVVSGYGTSGNVLTSQGAGNAPIWSSGAVDTSLNYNWTGTNRFKTLISSSTITISDGGAGVGYVWPSYATASSTCLTKNASAVLSWIKCPSIILRAGFDGTDTSGTASTTLESITIPANTLNTGSAIEGHVTWRYSNNANNVYCGIGIGDGTATTSFAYTGILGNAGLDTDFHIYAPSTSVVNARSTTIVDDAAAENSFSHATNLQIYKGSYRPSLDSTAAMYLEFVCKADTGGVGEIDGLTVRVVNQ